MSWTSGLDAVRGLFLLLVPGRALVFFLCVFSLKPWLLPLSPNCPWSYPSGGIVSCEETEFSSHVLS